MVVSQGDVYWASLPDPVGSGPGFRRPAVVVQGDALNATRLATVVVVPLTGSLRWVLAPGNVLLPARHTGLPRDSVAAVAQITSVDRRALTDQIIRLARADLNRVLAGIDLLLGRG